MLATQSSGWWFETPRRSCDVTVISLAKDVFLPIVPPNPWTSVFPWSNLKNFLRRTRLFGDWLTRGSTTIVILQLPIKRRHFCITHDRSLNHEYISLAWNYHGYHCRDMTTTYQNIISASPMLYYGHVSCCEISDEVALPRLRYDDVIKWKHFPCYWPFVRGIHRSPGNSPHRGQWRGALIFSLRLNKRLSKPARCRWFETPSRPLWRHCNDRTTSA